MKAKKIKCSACDTDISRQSIMKAVRGVENDFAENSTKIDRDGATYYQYYDQIYPTRIEAIADFVGRLAKEQTKDYLLTKALNNKKNRVK